MPEFKTEYSSEQIALRGERFISMLRHVQVLGLTVESADAAERCVVMKLPYAEQIIGNPMKGIVHGGALTTLMDTACGTAVFAVLPDFELCPTLDLRVDYMKAAKPGLDLLCRAKVTRVSGNVVFTDGEVFEQGTKRLVAKCSAAFMRIGADMSPKEFKFAIENGMSDQALQQMMDFDQRELMQQKAKLSQEK